MKKIKNVLVVGMPRSGTSMTTAIFVRQGFFVAEDEGKELRKGDEYNPSGYFEAEPLTKSNAAIFKAAGFEFDNTWLYKPITDTQANTIFNLPHLQSDRQLVARYNEHSPWVWKDPRLCYTLAYWWPLMDHSNTVVLLLKRDADEILQSFRRLKWRRHTTEDKQDVYMRITGHMNFVEQTIKYFKIPHIVIDYASYANEPEITAQRMKDFFGLPISAEELGYQPKLNNSGIRGRVSALLNNIADHIPDGLRKFFKRLMPTALLKILFPGRYSN